MLQSFQDLRNKKATDNFASTAQQKADYYEQAKKYRNTDTSPHSMALKLYNDKC